MLTAHVAVEGACEGREETEDTFFFLSMRLLRRGKVRFLHQAILILEVALPELVDLFVVLLVSEVVLQTLKILRVPKCFTKRIISDQLFPNLVSDPRPGWK